MKIHRTDGTTDIVDLGGKKVTLEQLQKAVGGYIEAVPGTGGRAYCNEEGRVRRLPYNEVASQRFGVELVGDVVALEKGERQ